MINIGNANVDQTIYIPFNTYDSSGASVTVTYLAVGDISIHKDGGTTQRTSSNGITLLINYDGVNGNHLITIDLSDNTDAGFYAAGSDYSVRLEGITVDTQTLNSWIALFSIENRFMRGTDNALLAANVNVAAGIVESNLKQIDDDSQSMTDLKDFADAGYDPSVNKVEGVKVVDVTTTNADMVTAAPTTQQVRDSMKLSPTGGAPAAGSVDEHLDDIDSKTTNLPADPASETNVDANENILNSIAGAGFVTGTDSLQAIRDRGDAAWTTGGAGGISDIINIQSMIPLTIGLANTVSYRLGLMVINSLDDLPSISEITPGTISIDRKVIGGDAWINIITDQSCSEIDGLIYYDEVFDTGTGYLQGDEIRITLKNQKITVAANDHEIIGATGRMFYTHIRQDSQINSMSSIIGGINNGTLTVDVITGNIDDIVSGQSLSMYRGDHRDVPIVITDKDGGFVDLTGSQITFSVKIKLSGSYIFQRKNTLAGGGDTQIEITDAVNGEALLKIVPANTINEELGPYQFDIELIETDDKVSTVSRGIYRLLGDVTVP